MSSFISSIHIFHYVSSKGIRSIPREVILHLLSGAHMMVKGCCVRKRQIFALGAKMFTVNAKDVSSQPFGARSFVVAELTTKRF